MPALSMVENSALATANLSGSRQQDLAKTGGPGRVKRWWRTGWLGGRRSGETIGGENIWKFYEQGGDLGMERRAARREEDIGGEEDNHKAGEPG